MFEVLDTFSNSSTYIILLLHTNEGFPRVRYRDNKLHCCAAIRENQLVMTEIKHFKSCNSVLFFVSNSNSSLLAKFPQQLNSQ